MRSIPAGYIETDKACHGWPATAAGTIRRSTSETRRPRCPKRRGIAPSETNPRPRMRRNGRADASVSAAFDATNWGTDCYEPFVRSTGQAAALATVAGASGNTRRTAVASDGAKQTASGADLPPRGWCQGVCRSEIAVTRRPDRPGPGRADSEDRSPGDARLGRTLPVRSCR